MIRVRIELCPLGDERPEAVREIGRMYIANDGTGTRERGDYKVAVCRKGTTAVPLNPKGPCTARGGRVINYPRLDHSVWRLITRALHVAFPEESAPAKRKAGDRPVLDAAVMRGLQKLAHFAPRERGAFPDTMPVSDHDDVASARDWLAAADLEAK